MLFRIIWLSVVATNASAPAEQAQEHVLIVATSPAQKGFLPEAKLFAEAEAFNPVTVDEIDAFLKAERLKDIAGCHDVVCYSEAGGALDIKYVVRIAPNTPTTRAILSIYSLFPAPKLRKQKLVSHETAQEALLRSVAAFRKKRQALEDILRQVPCGFPWLELRRVIGPPHDEILLPEPEDPYGGDREKRYRRYLYSYFDIVISVRKQQVRRIKDRNGLGSIFTPCTS